MSAVRTRVEVAALWVLLRVLGVLMALASRWVSRLRRQVTRDLIIEIASADGARQQFQFHAATRRLTLPRHPIEPADAAVLFPTARMGLRALLSRRTIGRVVEDWFIGDTQIVGNPVLILWFHGLTRIVAPIGSTRRPRRRVRRQGLVPVRAPEHDLPYASRIVREPATGELSHDWPQAWAARAKLLQIRATTGERTPPG